MCRHENMGLASMYPVQSPTLSEYLYVTNTRSDNPKQQT